MQLAELFDSGDDSELCDQLFVRICQSHGKRADASLMSKEERTVYLVWGALGVIGNGGFRYLLERNILGDPFFALTRQAFEDIGCSEAVAAFDQAFAPFPSGRPPKNPDDRLERYLLYLQRKGEGVPSTFDRSFFKATKTIEASLAREVRSHREAFKHLG